MTNKRELHQDDYEQGNPYELKMDSFDNYSSAEGNLESQETDMEKNLIFSDKIIPFDRGVIPTPEKQAEFQEQLRRMRDSR